MAEGNDAIQWAAWLILFGLAIAFFSAWRYVRRIDGEADDQETEVAFQELVRASGLEEVPDAGSTSRGEREGQSFTDGQAGEALPIELQPDRGEGEPGPG